MRPSLKALSWAWTLPALAASLAVPTGLPAAVESANGASNPSVELELQDSQAKATFRIPCPGCLGQDPGSHDDESLSLGLQIFPSDEPCGISNITLNGRYLAQEWTGTHGRGEGFFAGVPDLEKDQWFRTHDLDVSWDSTCLDDPESESNLPTEIAQVITVTVKTIDGKPLPQSAGFTLSFKQLSPPEFLRLEVFPVPNAGDQEFSEAWRNPPADLRVTDVTLVKEAGPKTPSLHEELEELKLLQQQAKELRDAIRAKKTHIRAHFRHDALTLTEALKECDSLACIVKTIGHKAHGAVKVIYIKLRPHRPPPPPRPEGMGRPHDDPYEAVWHANTHKQAPGSHVPPPPPEHIEAACHGNCSHPPPPDHGGHPPHHGPHGPHHGPHHGPPYHSPLVHALSIVASALGLTALLAWLHRRCCNLRAKTDRRAAREERRTAREYRHAARRLRRQAWASWWRRSADPRRIADYEEKRSLILEQESILEAAMQEEIRQFRDAHGLVNSIVQAEEGRIGITSLDQERHRHMSMPVHEHLGFTAAELPVGSSSPTLSRTTSLPDYRSDAGSTEPPAYEDDEDSSEVVVDGFREYTPSSYTPSTTTAWTPDSSVIDVSPRPSGETMRVEEYVQKN